MNKIQKYQELKKFVEAESWFYPENDEPDYFDDDYYEVTISTRDNGSVYDEQYGKKDWDEAQRLLPLIIEKFGDWFESYEITTFDEWVNIELIFN